MILHDITDDTVAVIKVCSSFAVAPFLQNNLHSLNVISIPNIFILFTVVKAKIQDLHHSCFSQIVINAIYFIFIEIIGQIFSQLLGRF